MFKRYVVFAGSSFYPSGGINDLIGHYDTLEAARAAATARQPYSWDDNPLFDWWHILDTAAGCITLTKNGDTWTAEALAKALNPEPVS